MLPKSESKAPPSWQAGMWRKLRLPLIAGTAIFLIALLSLGIYSVVEEMRWSAVQKWPSDRPVPDYVKQCTESLSRLACHEVSYSEPLSPKTQQEIEECARQAYQVCSAKPLWAQHNNHHFSQLQHCLLLATDKCPNGHPLKAWPDTEGCAAAALSRCRKFDWLSGSDMESITQQSLNHTNPNVNATGRIAGIAKRSSEETEAAHKLDTCKTVRLMYCDLRFSPNITEEDSRACVRDADVKCKAHQLSKSAYMMQHNTSSAVRNYVAQNGITAEGCIRQLTRKCDSIEVKTTSGLVAKKACLFREINVCTSHRNPPFIVVDGTGVASHGATHNGTRHDNSTQAGERTPQHNSTQHSSIVRHGSTMHYSNSTQSGNSTRHSDNGVKSGDHGADSIQNGTGQATHHHDQQHPAVATIPYSHIQIDIGAGAFYINIWLRSGAVVGVLKPTRNADEPAFAVNVRF